MNLLEAFLMTLLKKIMMKIMLQVGHEVPRSWPMDAAQDLQARVDYILFSPQPS